MGLSAWVDTHIIQQATCDHVDTTTGDDATGVASCSECNNSWPAKATPPVATLTRQVPIT